MKTVEEIAIWSDVEIRDIRKHVSYDKDTGVITRNLPSGNGGAEGREVKTKDDKGYLLVRISNKSYRAHRIAWLLATGEQPNTFVDHINGDKGDNKFSNLRLVSKGGNNRNIRSPRSHNSTGYLGVSKRNNGKYWAKIVSEGKQIYLGEFSTPELAHEAYLYSKRKLHKETSI